MTILVCRATAFGYADFYDSKCKFANMCTPQAAYSRITLLLGESIVVVNRVNAGVGGRIATGVAFGNVK